MCKTHRLYLAATAIVWMVAGPLFVTAPSHGPVHRLSLVLGCLAVVLIPYCAFPYLVADMMDEKLKDTTGAFLAGWQAAQEDEDEPGEPVQLHSVG